MPEGERSPKGIELQSSLGDHSQTFTARSPMLVPLGTAGHRMENK
jgi:hypothetical protein